MSLSFSFGTGRRFQDGWVEPRNSALTYSEPGSRGSYT